LEELEVKGIFIKVDLKEIGWGPGQDSAGLG
jgi:hypothetical protein